MEIIYHIVQFVPASDLLPLLSVSKAIRREARTRTVLYRDIQLVTHLKPTCPNRITAPCPTTNQITISGFALLAPHVGKLVRSLDIRIGESDKGQLSLILDSVPNLKSLTVDRDDEARNHLSPILFLPTDPCFKLVSLAVGILTTIENVLEFVAAHSESLENLELPAVYGDAGVNLLPPFPRIQTLCLYSELLWDIIGRGTVKCVEGKMDSPPPGASFPKVLAVKDHLIRTNTLFTLADLFPKVRFIQGSMVKFPKAHP